MTGKENTDPDYWYVKGPDFHRGIPLSAEDIGKALPYSGERWEDKSTRVKILHQALEIVTKDRNQDYGNPEDNFATIANYWTTYLQSKHLIPRSENLVASDVAAMMILMKCSRLATSPNKLDHWIDIAGYSACGGDCVQ